MKLARLGDGPEIFFSLQGEGKNQGAPSVFVRTSRCNLHCTWCDTPYTWNWRGSPFAHANTEKFDPVASSIDLPVPEVADLIGRWACRRVILTGGEPLLQASECAKLLELLRARDERYGFEIETNGTLVPSRELDRLLTLYTVSPKLRSSGVDASLRLRREALAFFAQSPKSVFKFVIGRESDVREVTALERELGLLPDRVFLMPQGTTPAALEALRPVLASACLESGYRYSDRLHIQLFGNRPGV